MHSGGSCSKLKCCLEHEKDKIHTSFSIVYMPGVAQKQCKNHSYHMKTVSDCVCAFWHWRLSSSYADDSTTSYELSIMMDKVCRSFPSPSMLAKGADGGIRLPSSTCGSQVLSDSHRPHQMLLIAVGVIML